MVVAVMLLVSGISIAASRRAAVDCAEDCKASRDRLFERCDQLSEPAKTNCRERATKLYDKCIERCNNPDDARPGD
jgi:hypothetical protein